MLQQMLALPIKEKIGQMFLIGLPSIILDEISQQLVKDISPGGVCLFARNVRTAEQVRELLDEIRINTKTEPILSLDQEGGLVDRLRRVSTPMPAANLITNSADAEKLARITAELIRILGFNLNFAPVVDVVDEDRKKFSNGLFSRAYGSKFEDVTELAGKYLEVLQQNGCIGTIKHFPGLGATEVDSHEELPVVNINVETLFNTDLIPYRNLFKSQSIYSVMIAHAAFPNIDLQETDQNDKLLPSSLSFNFVTKLLREELGFKGVAITDDLEMGAIVKNYGIGDACIMAINAGNDLLAICAGVESIYKGFEAVEKAVQIGEITEDRINQSIERIAKLKSILSQPLTFNLQRIQELSDEVLELNKHIKQNHGG